MELKSILLEYKKATEELIAAIKKEDSGEEFIEKREVLINKIKDMSFSQEELRTIYNEINLLEIEKEAYAVINNEKTKVKEELISLKKKREANNSYRNNFRNINILNTKI
ncbi:hypothetical protein [Clostridium sp. LP20]|uniref:hypothetical protein n=1 Tax=Clostridium sp. LP20 TaxID=3418665 RepID=UPI003EE70326